MNKPKTTTLNDLSLLGEVLTPSYAKGGVAEKTINGVKENQELRAKLTPKPRFNIGSEYLSSLDKQSPEERNTIYLDPMTEEQRELQYGARIEPLPIQTKRVSLLAKQNNRRY